ncbi:MAG: hypothetical protein KKB82_08805 [Candidatus Omnitrophica bacterium]|nr:hypothetical protein [Candidatus Omnitrophota bacterium]
MKFAKITLALAGICVILGIISRIMLAPIPSGMNGLEANAFLRFADTCLLATIALVLMEKK